VSYVAVKKLFLTGRNGGWYNPAALEAAFFEEKSCRNARISRKNAAGHASTGSASEWPPAAVEKSLPRGVPGVGPAWRSNSVTLRNTIGTASSSFPAGSHAGEANMQRRFRLHRSGDIQRVRRTGKSYAHPLLVLVAARNAGQVRRFAVSAGRRVGGAVERNRARRRIREAVRPLAPSLPEGWDYLLVARSGAASAPFAELAGAIRGLFARAGMKSPDDGHASRAG